MRIVAPSDIHGNLMALEAVLAAVAEPPDLWLVAGDLVAFGPQPGAVVERMRALGGPVLQGNLDDYVADPGAVQRLQRYAAAEVAAGRPFRPVMPLPLLAAQADWTRAQLTPEQLAYLRSLPRRHVVLPAPGRRLLAIHANSYDLERPILPDMETARLQALLEPGGWDVVVYGHVHVPSVRRREGCLLVNVASAGFPTDGSPLACYTELTFTAGEWTVTQHRVPYDLEAAAAAIAASGQPEPEQIITLLRTARRLR